MRTIVISGGNSGIGLEAGRQLVAQGHQVVLLGRDAAKGQAAVASMSAGPGKAVFLASDLSTHAGVKAAAEQLLAQYPTIDGLVLGAGVLMTREERTADGLHPVFAVNALSRYHLTQRLFPALERSSAPTVVILVAQVPLDAAIDFSRYPKLSPFKGMGDLSGIQISNHHYVMQWAKEHPKVLFGLTNVGLVKTDIMREMPAFMRGVFTVLGPLVTISVEKSAANAVALSTTGGWRSGAYWPKPGKVDQVTPLQLDLAVSAKVCAAAKELTGV
ncbi:MAG: SDR family NAD(P)-dependent oxidoreductase [Myxococcaceae bacterium]|nr:SDR family NAD(P)-dependent oxidoreductase [Myxococcaceae bacterium]